MTEQNTDASKQLKIVDMLGSAKASQKHQVASCSSVTPASSSLGIADCRRFLWARKLAILAIS